MCVRVADDLKLFGLLVEPPWTTHELAEFAGAKLLFITRILRVLVGIAFVGQNGKIFFSLPATKQMALPSVRAGVRFLYVHVAL